MIENYVTFWDLKVLISYRNCHFKGYFIKQQSLNMKEKQRSLVIDGAKILLHQKSRQSLRPSTGRIGWDFFSKIGIKWGTYFSKKVPIFETFWFTPAMHRPLTVKGVYVVSHSWYVQVYELVCKYIIKHSRQN